MFKDESISITQSIQNVKDIAKVFTDFSKTFSVPASKTNNKIFKHYYNYDIENGFDARKKKDATIELNNITFREGKIKLEGVDLKNNVPHTYRITFFGNTVSLKDLLGEDKLQGLDLSAYDAVYTNTDISTGLSTNPSTSGNDLIVPLITHTQRLFYDSTSGNHELGNVYYHTGSGGNNHGVLWSELKYALRVHKIIEAIEEKYEGITFSDDFFNTSNEHYYDLFMWLHRKKGDVENLSGVNESIVDGWLAPIQDYNDTLTKMVNSSTLGVIGDPFNYGVCTLGLDTLSTDNYSVSIQKDGVEVYNTGTVNGNQTIFVSDFGLEQGEYTVLIASDDDITFSSIEWDINYLSFNDTYDTADSGPYNYVSAFNFIISQQIPEIKVIDFLTGLFKMFNLTAYVENNIIVVKELNEFYNDGNSYDISKYVDVDKSAVNVALPYREINFSHEDTKTFLASKHNQLFGKEWGKESYVGGEKLDGSIYNVKTPFSQLKYERLINQNGGANTTVQVGYFVDDNQDPYYGKPLLFYPILNSGTPISFLTSEITHIQITTYNVPSNSVSLSALTNKKNINFFAETNEYDNKGSFTDTLFKLYYEKYITDVFNSTNRLTKVSAYLPLRILLNYTLADRFVINGRRYKINSITSNLETGKSELELLNDL